MLAAENLKDKRVGVIAGGHLTTEDAFAVSRLARFDFEYGRYRLTHPGLRCPYERLIEVTGAAGSNATLDDLDSAGTIVWVGPDPKEALPVLYLRLRAAVLRQQSRTGQLSRSAATHWDGLGGKVVRTEAGGEATALGELGDLAGPVVICWGPASPWS